MSTLTVLIAILLFAVSVAGFVALVVIFFLAIALDEDNEDWEAFISETEEYDTFPHDEELYR